MKTMILPGGEHAVRAPHRVLSTPPPEINITRPTQASKLVGMAYRLLFEFDYRCRAPSDLLYKMKTDINSCRAHHYDYWMARAAILVAAALNAFLINDLTPIPSWITSGLELSLLIPLSIATAKTNATALRAQTREHWNRVLKHRQLIRNAAMVLTALISAINFQSLFGVLRALLYGAKGATGQTLLIDALNIWITNVIVFALWFWNLDQGGPALRFMGNPDQPADFQFPQTAADIPGYPKWTPGFFDYLFVAYTNATAFSPTDTMPLSVRVKLMFMVQSFASLLTVGLLAARAVNILS